MRAAAGWALTAVTVALAYLGVAVAAQWWPFSAGPDVRIDLAASRFDPPGYDDPGDEYVCLVNASGDAVDLTGWQLRDAEGVVDVIPQFSLRGHGRVRVHPGRGRDSRTDLYGTEGSPVWTNEGDTVTLADDHGDEVASATYRTQRGRGGGPACGSAEES